jgi:hypothetical protein
VTSDGVPKLLDFGIAKLLDPASGTPAGAATLIRVLTPESASPEQLSGRPVTGASDVYALGVLLYRLLTGESPYRGSIEGESDLIREVCERTPDPPGARARVLEQAIPADLDRIVMKALRKEPERRYGSAAEFSEDVLRFLERRPVLASPDSVPYRARKFVARHRTVVAAAAACAVAVAIGVATTVWQARTAGRERTRAERQFNAVRGLARAVMGELHDAVANLPGSTPAQEILVRRATEYLDALARESGDDVELRRELAAGYVRLATLQGLPKYTNLGNREAARASLDKAMALLEALASDPRNSRDRVALVPSSNRCRPTPARRRTPTASSRCSGNHWRRRTSPRRITRALATSTIGSARPPRPRCASIREASTRAATCRSRTSSWARRWR